MTARSWCIAGGPPSRPPLRLVHGGGSRCPSDDERAGVYAREWAEYLGSQLEIRRMTYSEWRRQAQIVDAIARRVLPRRGDR